MNAHDILDLIGDAKGSYVWDAQQVRGGTVSAKVRKFPARKIWLIAAVMALLLMLVGCTVAYVNGWFVDFFSARSDAPLSDDQIAYIQEKEQMIQETQTKDSWTVELKSSLCAGDTAYAIFTVTAPKDIDLEGANIATPNDGDGIFPGNSGMTFEGRHMFTTSMDKTRSEQNVVWSYGSGWKADNDGRSNTLNYAVTIRAEAMIPGQPMALENPFSPEIEFYICFDNFVHSWKDPEVWQAIEEKYAGQDYIIGSEEMEGLYKSEVLAEGAWDFTITFDGEDLAGDSMELVTDYAMTWAQVTWKLDDEPLTYQTGSGIAPVKIVSFVLNPLGATVQYEFEEPMFSAFIEYQDFYGYEDRYVYAVMKDGSKIALHTHGTGDKLSAETPIVLSELDYVLLGDGGKLTESGEWIEPEF